MIVGKTINGRWEIGIGDPGVLGWVTVVSYLLAAFLCARLAFRCWDLGGCDGREFLWWGSLAVMLVVLGFNKQLDLQTLLTEIGRDLAKSQGWYERRRVVQRWFIAGIAIGGLFGLGLLAWFFRTCLWRNAPALVGITFLVCFVVIRAASFHHVDAFLGGRVQNVPINSILELSGIACIMLAAIVRLSNR